MLNPTRHETELLIKACKNTIKAGEFAIKNVKDYAWGLKFPEKVINAEMRIVEYQNLINELLTHLKELNELEKIDREQEIIDNTL